MLVSACGSARNGASATTRRAKDSLRIRSELTFHPLGRLPAPDQLPSTIALAGGRVLVLGGLSAADVSTDTIVLVGSSGTARAVGRLPAPVHDSAATSIGGRAYLFGGGD